MSNALSYDYIFQDEHSAESFWRSLPRRAAFTVRLKPDHIQDVLVCFEELGAAAMLLSPFDGFDWKMQAYKGKIGACYDTGRHVTFNLSDYAALDDDNHILYGQQPICEKTALIYQLPQYQSLLTVTEPEEEKMQRFSTDPLDFDCDNFESLSGTLRQAIVADKEEPQRIIFYPGPFRLLIAPDGSMLWRGQATKISANVYEDLRRQNVSIYDSLPGMPVRTCSYYDQLFDHSGHDCLLNSTFVPVLQLEAPTVRVDAVQSCSPAFKDRLRQIIHKEQTYFILSGSDPGDPLGCCPSDAVGQAQALCKAGVLEAHRQDVGGDACPITLFTFAGELLSADPLTIDINVGLRQQVQKSLNYRPLWLRIFQWLCLGFVVISLVIGLSRSLVRSQASSPHEIDIVQVLAMPSEVEHAFILFREQQRCTFCLNMERFTQEFLNEQSDPAIAFFDVDLSDAHYQGLSERLDVFTSTLVYVQLENGQLKHAHVVDEAWTHNSDQALFKQALRRYLQDPD